MLEGVIQRDAQYDNAGRDSRTFRLYNPSLRFSVYEVRRVPIDTVPPANNPNKKRSSLHRNPDFLRFWAGETISAFGSDITRLALPLTAVLLLEATAMEMGFLVAAQHAPHLVVSLPAGVWMDRLKRKPVLVAANLLRALLLMTIPVAAFYDLIAMSQLYLVSFLVGTFTVVSNVAYRAYFSTLVERDELVEGNAKLSMSTSLSQMLGPGLAGWLVQLLTAPFAILIDAITFVVLIP